MPSRHKRKTKSLLSKAAELAFAVPQVVAHRVTRMAIAGPSVSERDRMGFQRMGAEKITAFIECLNDKQRVGLCVPLMIAVQEMCGRVGLVTSKGLSAIIKEHYPGCWIDDCSYLGRFGRLCGGRNRTMAKRSLAPIQSCKGILRHNSFGDCHGLPAQLRAGDQPDQAPSLFRRSQCSGRTAADCCAAAHLATTVKLLARMLMDGSPIRLGGSPWCSCP